MTPTRVFAETLKTLRGKHQITQEELSVRAKYDNSIISRWERCERRVTRTGCERLADALNLTDVERMTLFISAGFIPFDDAELTKKRVLAIAGALLYIGYVVE